MVSRVAYWTLKEKIREETLAHRDVVKTRWRIDDERRAADEKMEQLKAVAESSIIIAGFTLSAICEMQISLSVPSKILAFYGLATSSAITISITSSTLSMFVLVALYTSKKNCTFEKHWKSHCENDWRLAFKCFVIGTCLFTITLAFSSWVLFWHHPHGYIASVLVSIICFTTIIYWYTRVYLKWYDAFDKGYEFGPKKDKLQIQYDLEENGPFDDNDNDTNNDYDFNGENQNEENQNNNNEEKKTEYPTE